MNEWFTQMKSLYFIAPICNNCPPPVIRLHCSLPTDLLWKQKGEIYWKQLLDVTVKPMRSACLHWECKTGPMSSAVSQPGQRFAACSFENIDENMYENFTYEFELWLWPSLNCPG